MELLVFMVLVFMGDGYGLKGDGYGLKGFSSCSIVPICDDIFKLLD